MAISMGAHRMSWALFVLVLAGCASTESATEPANAGEGDAAAAPAPAPVHQDPGAGPWDRPGFRTLVEDGRLWVFRAGSKDWDAFLAQGEPAKSVTRPGAGPGGMTIRSDDGSTIAAYMAAKDGFVTEIVDGRLWVFRPDSKDLAEFKTHGEPAKSVTRPGAGPGGMSIRSGDSETIAAYLAAKSGFVTEIVDGRLWVFRPGTKDLEEFKTHGEPAKSVTRPGAGPGGISVRSGDSETIAAYLAAR